MAGKDKIKKSEPNALQRFFRETIGELRRVSWPTRQELWDSTVVVIVAALLLGLFTSISDFSLYQFIDLFTKLAG